MIVYVGDPTYTIPLHAVAPILIGIVSIVCIAALAVAVLARRSK